MTRSNLSILPVMIMLLGCAGIVSANGPVWIEEPFVVAFIDGEEREIGMLGMRPEEPDGFYFMYEFSPDGDGIAFIGEEKGGVGLYVFRSGMPNARSVPAWGPVTARSYPVWSPDSRHVAASIGNRIWIYDTDTDEAWMVSEPEEGWMEDIDPLFTEDGNTITFYRGSTFEYTFSGDLYRSDLHGNDLEYVFEEFPAYPPEEFRTSGYDPWDEILMKKVEQFADDLRMHRYWGILLAYDPLYILDQLDLMQAYYEPVSEETFSTLFFHSAVVYEDYNNQVPDLASVDTVEDYFFDFELERVTFTVRLLDGREVTFSVFVNMETFNFYGPYG